MALSDIWTLTAGGVTKTCAAWGMVKMTRERAFDHRSGEVRFQIGANADSDLPFGYKESVTIARNGVPWFVGLVTKTPRMASPKAEALQYVISDPWWYLETTPFQQQWMSQTPGGMAVALMTTTQSRVTLGQSLLQSVISLNLGQVLTEVLYYALYAAQGIAFPTTVDANGLPTAPSMTLGPFQLGNITPSITEPFFEVRDLMCSEIVEKLLKYLPDTGKWFDFTTTPPTLHIDNRANLAAKTISVLGGLVTSEFNPTPRPDLQVPVVIFKYEQANTLDGQSYAVLVVDKYPADVLDNAPGALVQTVDLIGGNATYQKQEVVVCDAPRTEADAVAESWVKNNPLLYWLFGSVTYPSAYDTAGITIQSIDTTLNPNDPNNTSPEPGFALNALTEQLLTGAITQWMIDNGDCIAAKVIKRVVLAYSGSDTNTKNLFNFNPAAPNTLSIDLGCVCTNASSQTYEQLTSASAAEPAPTGNAEAIYNILSHLHQEGSLEITEDECSDLLPPGCIFNTSDGRAEWQAMNALILRVTEDIDHGKTKVEFGPTAYLGLQDLVELARANRGRLFATSVSQRTTGKAGGDNPVIGHAYSPENTFSLAPGGGAASTAPWAPTIINTAALGASPVYELKVGTGYLANSSTDGDNVAVAGLNTPTAFNASGDFYYLECPIASGVPGAATIKIGSAGTFNPALTAWDASGNAYLANDGATPPNQTFFRVKLGSIAPNASGVPVATPYCMSNLQIFDVNILGLDAKMAYPAPSAGA